MKHLALWSVEGCVCALYSQIVQFPNLEYLALGPADGNYPNQFITQCLSKQKCELCKLKYLIFGSPITPVNDELSPQLKYLNIISDFSNKDCQLFSNSLIGLSVRKQNYRKLEKSSFFISPVNLKYLEIFDSFHPSYLSYCKEKETMQKNQN